MEFGFVDIFDALEADRARGKARLSALAANDLQYSPLILLYSALGAFLVLAILMGIMRLLFP